MNKLIFLLLILAAFPFYALAHEGPHGKWTPALELTATLNIPNEVSIKTEGDFLVIRSNGIPAHKVGNFPNAKNPNRISAQNHVYRVPLHPKKHGEAKDRSGVIGIALNGVPIEPGTAECYGRKRGQPLPPGMPCSWREEAIVNGKGKLGLDMNNAHVQPTGAYHYHGVPYGLVDRIGGMDDLVQIGYTADGWPLVVSRSGRYKPSYTLYEGERYSGPGGLYDGTYTQDFRYKNGSGDLDQCNGKYLSTTIGYVYFMTEEFPFAPRCLYGEVDESFSRKGPAQGGMSQRGEMRGGPMDGRKPPPPHMRR